MATKNPILDELRATREELLAKSGGTLASLVAQLQEDEKKSDRQFIPLPTTVPSVLIPSDSTAANGGHPAVR